ncbi:MAG: carboxypeptidase regulatory-like domain-containing protein [Candidatus Doudnabacteria bacterium]|nr:carboxypeptidase regulatory-like domain-containing protein [Candidatus Doudnabacteria bacterium]
MSPNNRKILSGLFLVLMLASPKKIFAAAAQGTFWHYQCIDTVKYSRDTARAWSGKEAQLSALINAQMGQIANTGANCVAIDTPYDPEFTTFLSKWVLAARANGLMVWFRGNLSGWEGWFNYPRLSSGSQHNEEVYRFIAQNPSLFKDGDMFTPAPEPENGILGSPFAGPQAAENLRQFMVSSYRNCQTAFKAINKNVGCGFYSTNGDVAKQILNQRTVQGIGGLVAVDHYVKTAEQLESDLQNLRDEFGTNVFLGEFGAPIPDLQGNLTEAGQAMVVGQMLNAAYRKKSFITGINYWTLSGGSTALVNDDGSARQAYDVVRDYYDPGKITGTVYDDAGDRLVNAAVSDEGTNATATDKYGNFSLLVPAENSIALKVSLTGFVPATGALTVGPGGVGRLDFTLSPAHPSIFYRLKNFFRNIYRKFFYRS